MIDRDAMQMALDAMVSFEGGTSGLYRGEFAEEITALRAALEQPQCKPLTDEDIEQAQRTVWRSLPSDFDYTTSSWIEIGIRYAEAAHGIKGEA